MSFLSKLLNNNVCKLFYLRIPLCNLINQYMSTLAKKFPATKFIKSISTTCVPNYPDKNLPTIFVYFEGQLKSQIVGPNEFNGTNLKIDDFEIRLHRFGAVKSTLNFDKFEGERDGRLKACENDMIKTIRQSIFNKNNNEEEEDDY
jgi:hypothetical protein